MSRATAKVAEPGFPGWWAVGGLSSPGSPADRFVVSSETLAPQGIPQHLARHQLPTAVRVFIGGFGIRRSRREEYEAAGRVNDWAASHLNNKPNI